MIVNQFALFSLAEQMLGVEVIIPCNCISQLSTKKDNVFLSSERQILPKKIMV